MKNKNWKRQLLSKLNSCSSDRFKDTMLSLLKAAGFRNVQVTGSEDDMVEAAGVQWKGLLEFDTSILCLRNVEVLRSDVLDEFLEHFDHDREERVCGLLVTTAAVDTDMAEKAAMVTGGLFEVIGGSKLCDALQESGLASVRTRTVEDVELDLGQHEAGATLEREKVAAKKVFPDVLEEKRSDGNRLRDILGQAPEAGGVTRKQDGRAGRDNSPNLRSKDKNAVVFGEPIEGVSAKKVYEAVFTALAYKKPDIFEDLRNHPVLVGTKRRVIGMTREEVNSVAPSLCKRLSNGYFLGTHYRTEDKRRFIEAAVNFAGYSFGTLGEGTDVEIDF